MFHITFPCVLPVLGRRVNLVSVIPSLLEVKVQYHIILTHFHFYTNATFSKFNATLSWNLVVFVSWLYSSFSISLLTILNSLHNHLIVRIVSSISTKKRRKKHWQELHEFIDQFATDFHLNNIKFSNYEFHIPVYLHIFNLSQQCFVVFTIEILVVSHYNFWLDMSCFNAIVNSILYFIFRVCY